MNTLITKESSKSDVLELWWLKAKLAASGHNYAAVRAEKIDNRFTALNILLPMAVFILSICGSITGSCGAVPSPGYTYGLIIATGSIMLISYFQYVADNKAKSIEHKHARNEFDGLVQRIESIKFLEEDESVFNDLNTRLINLRRSSRHVPDEDWKKASEKYDADIKAVTDRLRNGSI